MFFKANYLLISLKISNLYIIIQCSILRLFFCGTFSTQYYNSILYIQVFVESPFKITNGSVTATSLPSKVGNTPKKTNMAKDKQTKKIKTTKCQKSLKISTSPDFLLNNSVAFREPQIFAQPERVEGQLVKDLSEVLSMLKGDLN